MTTGFGILSMSLRHVDDCVWIGLGSTTGNRCPMRDTYDAVAALIFN